MYLISGSVIAVLICLILLVLPSTLDASRTNLPDEPHTSKKCVLVLYSYGPLFPVQQQLASGFNAVIAAQQLGPQNVFHEYLDIIPLRTPDQKRLIRNMLLDKYAGMQFDLIITIADAALEFILNEGGDISPASPVLACNSREQQRQVQVNRKIHYIPFHYDLQGTLGHALKLFPKTGRVVFVAGKSRNDIRMEEQAQKDFAPWQGKLAFEYTSHLSVEEMLQRVKQLPADSIVIYSIVSSDRTGRVFIPKDILKMLVRESNAPFFGVASTYLGSGIVGGEILNIESSGKFVGQIAVDVLEGKAFNIERLPSFTNPMFDWKQLERWGGDASKLPQDSIFINRPQTLWSQYKAVVIGASATILILATLVMALVINIRRRVLAEQETLSSEMYFRTIFDTSNEAMHIHDSSTGAIIDVNNTMTEMLGYSRQEAFMLTPADLGSGFAPYGESDAKRWLAEAASGVPQTFEWQAKCKSGRLLWVEVKLKLVSLNKKSRIIATMRDISERKSLEEQLLQAQKMESVGRLAGGVAHDFNNMLGVIMGYTELSQSHLSNQDLLRRNLNEIYKAAERSRDITRQLLAFSRKELISPKQVDLNRYILGSEKNLGRLIGEDIRLSFLPSPDLWVIMIDPSQIDQITMNLSANARDAMPDGGRLTIETANVTIGPDYCKTHYDAVPGDYVLLSVSDTGHGMDRETREHIFEPFYTTKEVGKGTGLGLATVYGIVTQNRGFINVYSEPGQGTVFRIYFPRVLPEAPVEEIKASVEPAGSGTILIVEDDDMMRSITKEMLEYMGYTVILAETPKAAIDICENADTQIDLILTDVVMPGMNGRDMADRLKILRPDTGVLFMSGYTADLVTQRGIVEDGMYFIQKPFDMNTLSLKVREVIAA